MNIFNLSELLEYVADGKRIKYIFFWSQKEKVATVTKACLSQWYYSPFTDNGILFQTAEHFMMAEKAKLFNDTKVYLEIIQSDDPGKAKHLGRTIQNFDEGLWIQHRFDIVKKANILKFNQNPKLKEFLLATSNRVLVEASPKDKIWGIGLNENDIHIESPHKWKGLNLLGFALMATRQELETLGSETKF